ncbi:unnamed protein product [Linum tenue]|uniref:F-box domain-containing protein n=1 Tax=Linum tenue TaxID=586396 RepID=A0AAV0IEW0_9ROSI|nr:unnamed protein product [Linum tenue]
MASGSVSSVDEKGEDECSGGVDRISELPEGILLSILSLLSLKDAVKTSLLSGGWVNLWKSVVKELDFDAPEIQYAQSGLIPAAARRIKFKNFVNRVVRQLKDVSSGQITKFRVSFTLTNQCNSKGAIDKWLKFALSKRVIELSLVTYILTPESDGKGYVFPEDCFDHIKTPAGLSDIRSIRTLRLSYVAVKAETIEHFISHCPYLEELAVRKSDLIVKLRVAAAAGSSSLALKRLEVGECWKLKTLEIDNAPCLTHFTYEGGELVELRLENCVSLVDVNLGLDFCTPSFAFDSISCYARQLAALTVRINQNYIRFSNVAEFTHLEQLTIETIGNSNSKIIRFVTLINACPRIHTLRLKLYTYLACEMEVCSTPDVARVGRESIKTVEIIGFNGFPIECEFIEYVLECFVGMERIVLHLDNKNQVEEARSCALEFKARASPAIEFVVADD